MVRVRPAILRIRLSRRGCTNRPFYHIVVAHNKSKRDGKHLEQVGCYDPMPNYNGEIVCGLNIERIKYWLSNGVQPTTPVSKLLGMAGVTPPPPSLYLDAKKNREMKAEQAVRENADLADGSDSEVSENQDLELDQLD